MKIVEYITPTVVKDDVMRATIDIPDIRYAFLAIPDTFVTGYGPYEYHCAQLGLSREGIITTVQKEFGVNGGK